MLQGQGFCMAKVCRGLTSTEVAAFDGVKQSGLGRAGSRHGLDCQVLGEFLDRKPLSGNNGDSGFEAFRRNVCAVPVCDLVDS